MKEFTMARNLVNKRVAGSSVARRTKKSLWIELICSLLLLLFSYAGISKLTDYHTFSGQLAKSPYLEPYASTIAWLLPVTECLIVLLLLYSKTRLAALFASFALMLAFTIYIYMMLHYSYYVPCSCGGVLAIMSWDQHFWFNVVFTLLALAGIYLHISQSGVPTQKQPS